MGETAVQKKIFTMLMCLGMVLGMTIYNIILHSGFNSNLIVLLFKELWLVFIIALLLDLFIVGPFVKKIVSKVTNKYTKKIYVILGISCSMVVCMVLLMSIFGSIMSQGFTLSAIDVYPRTVFMNFIVALPLNLLIVSPGVRMLFIKIFPEAIIKIS
ncbi:DUF2798 domain-containing protein [Thiospirochaeta perfilievii]|uniref:DUF2798 domain-containing protein n=1 Tax=Thiospirochaeta perfilievii TaxID=252967 RepID=A0A5C1Q8C5_9SPIO|nr:DUF2798 domain-containing protein [Thiospirochaeta perfilievii]QEN04333.1 DUF2798 domain-containing protein [Thiospirochaeta perfilievii]